MRRGDTDNMNNKSNLHCKSWSLDPIPSQLISARIERYTKAAELSSLKAIFVVLRTVLLKNESQKILATLSPSKYDA
jgi:hypothetical protein